MSSESKSARVWYENLDTSFVNLWALLRFLAQKSFIGRVRVELENYSADIFLDGSETPLVHEVDRQAGTDVLEQAALHRLVLRVREEQGTITVLEGADEAVPSPPKSEPQHAEPAAIPELIRSDHSKDEAQQETIAAAAALENWNETSELSGQLIAAVESAAIASGADFESLFREARIALADDYGFLDPLSGLLRYKNASVNTNGDAPPVGYVAGVSEALRRVVNHFATGERERRARERVALELARVARKQSGALARSGFGEQLDRIAGTKVI